MKVACEACGTPDVFSRRKLLQSGLREWPDVPAHRGALLCDRCRGIEIAMIQSLLQEAAEADIAQERTQQGLSPLPPDGLFAAARLRWKWHGAESAPLEAAAAAPPRLA